MGVFEINVFGFSALFARGLVSVASIPYFDVEMLLGAWSSDDTGS